MQRSRARYEIVCQNADWYKAAQRLSSAAASASQQRCQKANDRARAAVGCNDGFGGLAAVVRVLPADAPHPGSEPRGTTGVRWNHTRTRSRPAQRAFGWNQPPHTITPARRAFNGITRSTRSHGSTTGHPHHGRSNHACTTRFPHHEPSYHASTTRTRTTGTGTTRVHESRRMDTKKGMPTTLPQPPNGLPISCAPARATLIDRY